MHTKGFGVLCSIKGMWTCPKPRLHFGDCSCRNAVPKVKQSELHLAMNDIFIDKANKIFLARIEQSQGRWWLKQSGVIYGHDQAFIASKKPGERGLNSSTRVAIAMRVQ